MNNNKNNNDNNGNQQPPRKKRRWHYKVSPPIITDSNTSNKKQKTSLNPPPECHQNNHKKEQIENEKQVLKMEEQLHEYFHKTNTPYSYINDKGIYNFTPVPVPAPAPAPAPAPVNPFMNMIFNPFVPSNSLHPPNLWESIFQAKMADSKTAIHHTPSQSVSIIDIRENIQHIDDIIALCDKYPLADNKKYNINMTAIHAIREPLTDLSNMVGMETIKRTIVDQLLYYLQELHIPNNIKKNEQPPDHSDKNNEPRDNIFNPFASPFPAFQSSSVEFNPPMGSCGLPQFNIKKPLWGNGGHTDEFALPTKGDFMHTVIYGPPGSGKTEVAKIIGRIFSNLGILSKKIFKKVSRNDLVAGYLGQTAIKTKDMIKASLGGVLFIDEAYSLGNSEKKDSFAKECVDTLCEALSEHKHNWMVIIAGYEKELNDCFFSLNEGLNSRFTWRFKLDAYKPCELKSIYEKQVKDYGWCISETDVIPLSWFASRMEYFTTYGRDMETLFTKTKIAHSRRVFCLPMSEKKIITFADLENGFKLFIENPEVKARTEGGIGGPYMKTLYL